MITPALSGFALGGGLIIAIGAQNAFILRQGLIRQHVFILCLICALSDAALIALGVAGLGALVEANPALTFWVAIAGAAFLICYGLFALNRARHPQSMTLAQENALSARAAIATVLGFTFLNPHVYLDTVVLVGGLSAQYQGTARLAFAIGAMSASFVWFFGLGYGARLLTPIFTKARSWQVLDLIIAAVMFWLAASLLLPLI
ncbi:MAG: LysE/ArgO family amino acid transporter [Pseudomonadota bacterium]